MTNFVKVEKNHYPVDSAIRISYNRLYRTFSLGTLEPSPNFTKTWFVNTCCFFFPKADQLVKRVDSLQAEKRAIKMELESIRKTQPETDVKCWHLFTDECRIQVKSQGNVLLTQDELGCQAMVF